MDITLEDDFDFNKHSFREISLAPPEKEVDPLFLSQRPFAERVTPLSVENSECTYLLDGLIRIIGPSDAMRIQAMNHWESKKHQANWWLKFHIVVIVGTIALGAFFPVSGIIGGICIVLAMKNSDKINAAQKQIDQWNRHPAQTIADIRNRAYSKGFFYVFNHDLKGSFELDSKNPILHPTEVTWFYEQALRALMNDVATQMQRQHISSSEKKKWIERFINENPLSLEAIAYAYEPNDPKRMILEAWACSFDAYKQDVVAFQQDFKDKKIQISNRTREEIRQLEEQRNLDLQSPRSTKKAGDMKALKVFIDWLKESSSSEEQLMALENYYRALSKNETLCSDAEKPIQTYYNERIEDVKTAEANSLLEIQKKKNLGWAPYFEPGLRLFADAFQSWQMPQLDLLPSNDLQIFH